MSYNITLRAKIVLTIVLLTLCTLAFVVTILIASNQSQYRSLIPFLFETINQSNLITSAASNNNAQLAQKGLESLRANPNILSANIFYRNNLTNEALKNKQDITTSDKNILTSLNQNIQLNKPILFFQQGDLALIYPIAQNNNSLMGMTYVKAAPPDNNNTRIFFEVILLIAIIATFVAMRLAEVIDKPLLNLATLMQKVTINNDYSIRAKKISSDEVGTLVDTFNAMLVTIQTNEKMQRVSQEQIKRLAYYDSLTGLPNRDFFKVLLQQSLLDMKQNKKMGAILFLNIDNFKLLNDKFGHDVGDILLQNLAKNLQNCLNDVHYVYYDDTSKTLNTNIARLSNDEFVITLKNIKNIQAVENLAKKILALNHHRYHIYQHDIVLTTSIGIAVYPQHGTTSEALFKHADIALYRAKESGKNCYKIFNSQMHSVIMHKMNLENDLSNALNKNEFAVFYQPKFHILSNKIIGFEALLRWKHPKRGYISPEEFIPHAERTGLIIEIGAWIIKEACLACKKLHASGFPEINLAVNLSARQFYEPLIAKILEQAMSDAALQPHYLEIELTESLIMMNDTETLDRLHQLKSLGLKISIDDFGTGYSSLRYLTHYPIDSVKIDKSFISYVIENKNNNIITKAIIDLAHNLNLSVIAEGVETEEQFDFLKINKCDEIQGFLISRPLPENELSSLLNYRKNSL